MPDDTRPTLAERTELGRSWREAAPLDAIADFSAAADRPNPLDVLAAQDAARVPELVPIRYGRMGASAFAFYRGTAAVMAADLAPRPRTTGATQLCGDAHVANFGIFAAPDRALVFDINDFDETLPGPFEWDVLRLGASIVLAARDRGFDRDVARAAARATAAAYREAMAGLATRSTLDVWYARVDEKRIADALGDSDVTKRMRRAATGVLDKARTRTSLRAAERLTEVVGGVLRFREAPPLISRAPLTALDRQQADDLLAGYHGTLQHDRRKLLERFARVDAARKVVGVGSVGTQAYVVLFEGRDGDDPLVLQIKQAQPSVLEQYLGASEFDHSGRRVVEGQRYAQAASDILLGWVSGPGGNHFYVRQLYDMKGSINLAKIRPDGLRVLGRLCGVTLARAHARGGDPVAIAAYLGDDDTFDRAVARFSRRYAKQAEADFAALRTAVADGRVEATSGV
jgi:uncharacterized protein (DUF2252 family)